ncbi:MAG: SpoIIE family protein phosphatase [Chloroflexota bacterium]
MDPIPSVVVASLTKAWETLTGGGLSIVVDEGKPLGSIPQGKFPRCVRDSLQARGALSGVRVRSRTWWVTTPTTEARRLQIVAWSVRTGRWEPLLQSWTDLLASLHEIAETSRDLTEQLINSWDRLAFLYQLARIASGPSELPEMLSAIVRLLAQVVQVEEAFLAMELGEAVSTVTASGKPLERAQSLLACVRGASRPLALAEVRAEVGERSADGDLLLAPMTAGSTRGVLGLASRRPKRFDANDLQLLASVAEHVGALIESAEARVAQMDRQRLEHELALAAELQRTLLPVSLPQIEGVQLAAYLKAARRVGGDLYDAVVTASGEVVLLLADAAGKGMPAALITALVHAVFRGECAHNPDPGELLGAMNHSLFADLDRTGTFVTAAVLRIGPRAGSMAYASAGHLDLALCRGDSGSIEYLPATGLPLGIDPQLSFASRPLRLSHGDTLVVYSDGVTEAEDADGELFGMRGLEDIMSASYLADADTQLQTMLDALEAHRSDKPLRDDVAMLFIRGEGPAARACEVHPFVIPAKLSSVAQVVAIAREASRSCLLAEKQSLADDFGLALSEIVTNQVQHACSGQHGLIWGRVVNDGTCLRADSYDRGIEFHAPPGVELLLDPLNPPDRGYGLRLARGLTDVCEYRRLLDGRNHWRLIKRLGGADNP